MKKTLSYVFIVFFALYFGALPLGQAQEAHSLDEEVLADFEAAEEAMDDFAPAPEDQGQPNPDNPSNPNDPNNPNNPTLPFPTDQLDPDLDPNDDPNDNGFGNNNGQDEDLPLPGGANNPDNWELGGGGGVLSCAFNPKARTGSGTMAWLTLGALLVVAFGLRRSQKI